MKDNYVCGASHVGLFIKDMSVSKDFYVNKLGFEVLYEDVNRPAPGVETKFCFITLKGMTIELVQRSDYAPKATGPIDHITLYVSDLDKAVESIKQKGITPLWSEPKTIPHFFGGKGTRFMFFEGPDGERIEFEQYHEGWN